MNKILILLALIAMPSSLFAQHKLNLEEVIARALAQSPASKRTETSKLTRYWQYRTFRARFNPQLTVSGNAPSYGQGFTQVIQPDGTRLFQPINQTNSLTNVGLIQPLRWTGGTISANTNFNFFNDIARNSSAWNSNLFFVSLNQPLYAFNPFKWDRRT